tara:strand:+ start:2505 stop:2870 length:366 start_codon:yes stop_codon:yes gene_type:complete
MKKRTKNEFDLNPTKNYHFVIMPPDDGKNIRLRLSKTLLWSSAIGFCMFIIILLFSGYYVFSNSFNHRQVAQLKRQTTTQDKRLKYYETELSAIKKSIQSLWNESEEMNRVLNRLPIVNVF